MDPLKIEMMSRIREMSCHGDFVIFRSRRERKRRRRKTDPYYKANISASRRRRTKTCHEKL